MIEIPIKKRHTEVQKQCENVWIKDGQTRALIGVLATIADRLTDIADELEKGRQEDE